MRLGLKLPGGDTRPQTRLSPSASSCAASWHCDAYSNPVSAWPSWRKLVFFVEVKGFLCGFSG